MCGFFDIIKVVILQAYEDDEVLLWYNCARDMSRSIYKEVNDVTGKINDDKISFLKCMF